MRIPDKPELVAAIATILIALVIITPLCGLLFACGCAWPWSGFVSACNYYQPDTEHQCPWCKSDVAGWFSVGAAMTGGLWAALFSRFNSEHPEVTECLIRISLGLLIFAALAVLTAWLALKTQGYPLGPLAQ